MTTTLSPYTTTLDPNALIDRDGNEYHSVIIGNQEWLIENLKTTRYADGTAITNILLDTDWFAEFGNLRGAYCWYDNDINNKDPYGAIYSGYAVVNAHGLAYFTRNGIQESGWRIPSEADWQVLFNYVSVTTVGGGKLKEIGFEHWDNPNTGATNEFGFKAVAGGMRTYGGVFVQLKIHFNFWSTTVIPDFYAPGLDALRQSTISYDSAAIIPEWCQELFLAGMSVRCMRDYTPPTTTLGPTTTLDPTTTAAPTTTLLPITTAEPLMRGITISHKLPDRITSTDLIPYVTFVVNPGLGDCYEFLDMFINTTYQPTSVIVATDKDFTDPAVVPISKIIKYNDGWYYIRRLPKTIGVGVLRNEDGMPLLNEDGSLILTGGIGGIPKVLIGKVLFVKIFFDSQALFYDLKLVKTGYKSLIEG